MAIEWACSRFRFITRNDICAHVLDFPSCSMKAGGGRWWARHGKPTLITTN